MQREIKKAIESRNKDMLEELEKRASCLFVLKMQELYQELP